MMEPKKDFFSSIFGDSSINEDHNNFVNTIEQSYSATSLISELLKDDSPNQIKHGDEGDFVLQNVPLDSNTILNYHPRPVDSSDSTNQPPKKKRKTTVNLSKLIRGLTKEQLEEMILNVTNELPDIEETVRKHLPTFDIQQAIQEAQKLKKKLFQEFPNTRYGSPYDHYAFTRVKSSQSAYSTAVRKPLTVLSSAKQWSVLLDYILAVIEESAELPDWDCEADRKPKQSLFKAFASHLLKILERNDFEISNTVREEILNVCQTHNKISYGTPFAECISYIDQLK